MPTLCKFWACSGCKQHLGSQLFPQGGWGCILLFHLFWDHLNLETAPRKEKTGATDSRCLPLRLCWHDRRKHRRLYEKRTKSIHKKLLLDSKEQKHFFYNTLFSFRFEWYILQHQTFLRIIYMALSNVLYSKRADFAFVSQMDGQRKLLLITPSGAPVIGQPLRKTSHNIINIVLWSPHASGKKYK